MVGSGSRAIARLGAFFASVLMLALMGGAVASAAAETRPQARGAAVALSPVAPGAPAATSADDITVEVKRADYAEPDNNPNAVSVDVIVRDKAGNPPTESYKTFIQVFKTHQVPIVKSEPLPCQQPKFTTNPDFDLGMYRCSFVVDKPDIWTFEAFVNQPSATKVIQIGHAQGTFPVSDAAVLGGLSSGLRYVVEGRTFEVFLLQAHFAAASIWLLMVTVMAFLAVPRLRRMLSVLTLHTLEVRRGFLNSVMWAMFAAVLGTGIYLLRTQTAYAAPWSKSAWDNITKLPYASMYFTTLYIKILLFVIMAAASVVLMQEAARQARLAGDTSGGMGDADDDEFWGRLQVPDGLDDVAGIADRRPDAGAATKVQTAKRRAPTTSQGVSARTLWLCVFAVAGGMGAVGACVTVLKYTHELIEMLVAAKTIAEN